MIMGRKLWLVWLPLLAVFLPITAQAANQSTPKKMVVHYRSTTGKKIKGNRTLTSTGSSVLAYGSTFGPQGTGIFGRSQTGYVAKIKGYVPFKIRKTYRYQKLPASITVKYIKESTLNEKVAASYMKQFNAYRKQQGLNAFKHRKSLLKKVNVRAHELWIRDDHIRPNGQSYNAKLSGYGETMAELPAYYLPAGYTMGGLGATLVYNSQGNITYKGTAKTAVNELMTCDKLHRDTELNTWAHYSEVGFSFAADGSGMMAQLFQY
ncbi:CAP domain-containing protein [Levilactobacillus tangyuanensis]|uniref:CAP domain-containing protein n=1 Tax=Levilactobacillus tangyuanensis TaxID=2486021 RepID=A0ABW1TNJ2_9LACO|nr:CAP domain-containing protein [Levilactobacillus tangyuanensis]